MKSGKSKNNTILLFLSSLGRTGKAGAATVRKNRVSQISKEIGKLFQAVNHQH